MVKNVYLMILNQFKNEDIIARLEGQRQSFTFKNV
jgi:hypothetical protein